MTVYSFNKASVVQLQLKTTDNDNESKIFLVHEHVLTAVSGIFRAALTNDSWNESKTKTYTLEDGTNFKVVNRFVQWLYSGHTDLDEKNAMFSYDEVV